MFEAGRKSLFAFSSKSTRPVSSETTLMPTIAACNSGFLRIEAMRLCSSESVFVVSARNGARAGVGAGDGCADWTGVGLVAGAGVGEGVGLAVWDALALRSRCGC